MDSIKENRPLKVLSLFTGAGGLDLGLEASGMEIECCVELDEDARETLAANRPSWKLATPADVLEISPRQLLHQAGLRRDEVDILSGGPPCQPFSVSSHWTNGGPKGLDDPRAKTIDAYISILEYCLPKVLLLENVEGIARSLNGRESGISYIESQVARINKAHGTKYTLGHYKINAADYGVPQKRERIFLIAAKNGKSFSLPPPSYGKLKGQEPYLTAWDALGDLDEEQYSDELRPTGRWANLLSSIPEGQNYLYHTSHGKGLPLFGWRRKYWSFLLKLAKDSPSWTIQASPGPAAGPFHWKNRMLSIEELLRLQTFPSSYQIKGDRRSAHRQIGNAVPSALGEFLGREIQRQLFGVELKGENLSLLPKKKMDCPRATRTRPVPIEYHYLIGEHPDHPGTGKGPGKIHASTSQMSQASKHDGSSEL